MLFFFTRIGKHQTAGNKSLHRQHKFVAIQFIDNDSDRHKFPHSVSLLKDRHIFLKENWDWTCYFSGKQLAFLMFEIRLSKKDPDLE